MYMQIMPYAPSVQPPVHQPAHPNRLLPVKMSQSGINSTAPRVAHHSKEGGCNSTITR